MEVYYVNDCDVIPGLTETLRSNHCASYLNSSVKLYRVIESLCQNAS